jgi:hypothetical protein
MVILCGGKLKILHITDDGMRCAALKAEIIKYK